MFHKHKWEYIETYKFDSLMESGRIKTVDGYTPELFRRGIISVVKCECGEVAHIKTIL